MTAVITGQDKAGNLQEVEVSRNALNTNPRFKQVSSIIGAFNVAAVAVNKAINGKDCTVNVLSGAVWINPLATAVANDTAIKLISGNAIDINVAGNLSLISDATGASVQIIVWED
jgi:hypothetical protein